MGLKKLLARNGAVGQTVQWAITNYKAVRAANPAASDSDIFNHMIVHRLAVQPDSGHFAYMESFLKNPSAGLQHILIGLVSVESGFIYPSTLPDYAREIIEEELAKSGLPQSVIHGTPKY